MTTIFGNVVGGVSSTPKSYILETEDGVTLTGVLVGEETVFDATPNDVRVGKTFASSDGVKTGEKIIPAYHVTEGYRVITQGSTFDITNLSRLDLYDFTKLQALMCPFAGSLDGSVAADKVAINEGVYPVNSTELLATVTRDSELKRINFGITNNSDSVYLLRYFTYKEID